MAKRQISGITINTKIREFEDFNNLEVEVGTTGFCGGDSGYGGRTYIRITDLLGTDLDIRTYKDKYDQNSVELLLGGDSELKTMIAALEFILTELKDTAKVSEEIHNKIGKSIVDNPASWKQIGYISHLCEESDFELLNMDLISKPIAGSLISFLKNKNEKELPDHLQIFLNKPQKKAERLKFSEEEKDRRRELGLPITKQLRFMRHLPDMSYQEILVDNYNYEIVRTYEPSGTHVLRVSLETGEQEEILLPFFVHMQEASFVDDMKKVDHEE